MKRKFRLITPASVDVKRGGNFASFCKICDAFYGQLEALVRIVLVG